MATGWLLISELPLAIHCETIVIFSRSAPSAGLKFLHLGHRPKQMSCPWMKSARCLQYTSVIGTQEVNNLVIGTRSLYANLSEGLTHILKIWGWRQTLPGSLPEPFEESFSILLSDAECQSLAKRQLALRARGCKKLGVIQWGCSAGAPMILGPWEVIPPLEVPSSPEELVVAPDSSSIWLGYPSCSGECHLLSNDLQACPNGCQDLNFLLLCLHQLLVLMEEILCLLKSEGEISC